MTALFISDLHLCRDRPDTARVFIEFLEQPARGAATLAILGDLFEYWAGDDDLGDPFVAQACAALRRCADAGVKISFIAGNRDFLAGSAFANAAGLEILPDPCLVDIAGAATLLTHGDTLCTDDRDYQAFRAEVRTDAWRRAFLARPLAERKAQIEALRDESEVRKRVKSAEIMDANPDAIVRTLRAFGCTRIIHGHTHRPGHHIHDVDGTRCERWVLPAWYESGGYLACDDRGCRAVTLG
jgi:UDP-2,3-diacylglucosamine hydrolase